MGHSSEEDIPVSLESCKRNKITHTYARHHWQRKTYLETGSSKDRNEQDDKKCIENHSVNVGEEGEANVSEDEEVSRGSSFISLLGNRKVSISTTTKTGTSFKLGDVPTPATPDIVTEKHGKRVVSPNEDASQEPHGTGYGKASAMDSKKRTCCRSLDLDTRNLERKAQNDLVFDETDDDSEVEEHDPKMTEKGCHDAKSFGCLRTLLVYGRRTKAKESIQNCSSSLPNELKATECNEGCDEEWQKSEKESLDKQIKMFMTCMNHIQGERKYSEWKGSVMDSIVGAYLAQNVNDTLSSSAFMSLAAKFPRKAVKVSSPVEACRKDALKGKHGKKDGRSSIRNSTRQRIKTRHNIRLLNVLKDCSMKYHSEKKMSDTLDAIDWDLVRMAEVNNISEVIQIRGMNVNLATRIKDCLEHLVKHFGNTDMEWIRDVPPDEAKEYLLSIYGLGLKSVECIRLLTLRQKAFPIDRNAGRVAVRLGWFPLKELPAVEFHLLKKQYPKVNSIQMYLWPYLSHLEWKLLYELHCQIITFGKAFCTERNPNCNECPMRAECSYFASVQASAEVKSTGPAEMDMEDYGLVRPRTSKTASVRVVKKKRSVTSLRTEHQVYLLPSGHDLLSELESRECGEPCLYLLAIWTPDSLETDECILEEDTVYGTFLIPARTATGGTFPLNGTFFQANEVFADDESSEVPIKVPRASLMNLSCTTLYCGKSMPSICEGMTSVEIQKCFKSGFACFRGFNRKTREPKPLLERFHNRAGMAGKTKKSDNRK